MENIGAAQMFRDLGIPDAEIRTLTGYPNLPEHVKLAENRKAERLRDHAWTKEFLAGNGEHVREMTRLNVTISGPVKEKEA